MNTTRENADADVWTLSFKATGEGPPVEIRVRRLLKTALRAYGLRCCGYGDLQRSEASKAIISHEQEANRGGREA